MRFDLRIRVLQVLFLALLAGGLWNPAVAGLPARSEPAKTRTAKSSISPTSLKGKIIFARDKDVYAINPDGSGEVCLIDNIRNYGIFNDISHDGRRILYANWGNVFLFSFHGRKLNQFQVGGEIQVHFSPDGMKAISSSVTGDRFGNILGDLYELDLNAGTFHLNSGLERKGFFGQPAWSSDGKRLVFVGSEETLNIGTIGMNATEIYTMNSDGANRTPLTKNEYRDAEPIFSLDGERIAFVRHVTVIINNMPIATSDIHIVRSNGTEEIRVTHNIAWTTSGLRGDQLSNMNLIAKSPVFSPDGKQIAFTQNGVIHVLDMRFNTYSLRRLTGGEARRWM